MKLYIAGPMTGYADMNFPAFNRAERQLQEAGFETSNPARHGAADESKTWADFMRLDIADMLLCDGIALLDGWQESRGAKLEVHLADELEIPVKLLDDWLGLA